MTTTNQYFFFVYGSFFLASVILSLLINRLFLNFVKTLGIRNAQEPVVRWSTQTKPAVGGFSFYIIFLLSVIGFSIFFDTNRVFLNKEFIGILLASMLGFLVGLTDDAYNTKPFLKLAAQITCGVILALTGSVINFTPIAGVNYFLTVFWTVGIMNSLNLLDNMDGITGSVSMSIVMSGLAIMILHNQFDSVYFIIMTGVLASLLGFLYYNWHPSKMYMGDTGSQFLGVFLAAMGIKFLWNAEPSSGEFISVKNLLLPVIVFIMPLIDTTTVFMLRILRGQSPFVGGKDHTTHALAKLGFSERQVAVVFAAITIISVILIVIIERYLVEWNHFYTILFSIYVLLMFFVFYYVTGLKSVQHT
jgi:UDP-GlcNAc:undecaprenyl-phosphate/decaprenyl-phosphate GlcNAc-1-phosphate transferase